MKRRYVGLIFFVIVGAIFWGLVHVIGVNTPTLHPSSLNDSVPAPVPVQVDDLMVVTSPTPGQTIASPLTVTGKAKGNWYFEGSFPVTLTTVDGTVVAQGIAKAQSSWTTTDYVPFIATLTFVSSSGSTAGYLILKKDNPSGDPRFDKSVSIKVQY
jgi:hypothetical protein